jgi:hypothetical protein
MYDQANEYEKAGNEQSGGYRAFSDTLAFVNMRSKSI